MALSSDTQASFAGPALATELNAQSADFKQNQLAMQKIVDEWRKRVALAKGGGGQKAIERHKSRGKLTARERIDQLLDPGSSFLELSTLAAWEMYEDTAA